MEKVIYILTLFCCALQCRAQQNLFNVPSSDLTEKNNHFIQYQANLSFGGIQNNLTYTYGLGKNFEAGINAYEINFSNINKPRFSENISDNTVPYSPLVMINLQKGFEINKHFKIGIGAQTGSSINFHLCNFSFINTNTNLFNNKLRIMGGAYYSNRILTGNGNNFGLLAGMEIPLFKDKFVFTSDYVSGKNSISVGVIGFAIKILKHLVFSAGYQYAGYHSPNNNGVVFELTKI